MRKIPGARRGEYGQRGDRYRNQRGRQTSLRFAGLRLRGDADLKRIDPNRFGDVLELGRAKVADREIEAPLDLPIGILRQADRARLANAFEARGDIDAVAHQIAVGLLDDIPEVNADAKFDALFEPDARVAVDHGVLHFECATHGIDHAAELDDAAVAGALDNPAVMHGDRWIDQIATQRAQPRQGSIFVRAREPAVADHIRD